MLPIIHNCICLSIGEMHETTMRYIFEKLSVDKLEQEALQESLLTWSRKPDLTASDKWELKRIVNALIADEKGHFNRAKELLNQNKWHYRKLYRVGLPYIANPDKCRTFGKINNIRSGR